MKKLFLIFATSAALLVFAPATHADSSTASKEFTEQMTHMHHAMDIKPTGDADKDFVAMMIPHHQGAVDMAKTLLKFGKDPMLKKMAQDIIDSQEKEITFMKEWQTKQK